MVHIVPRLSQKEMKEELVNLRKMAKDLIHRTNELENGGEISFNDISNLYGFCESIASAQRVFELKTKGTLTRVKS